MGLEPLLLRAFGTSQGNHFFFGLGTFPADEHRRGVLSNSQSNKIKTQTRGRRDKNGYNNNNININKISLRN